MKDKIYLKYKGRDSWDRPVYQDESGKLWKDVEPYSDRPAHLCSACDNAFDGEPDIPMNAIRILLSSITLPEMFGDNTLINQRFTKWEGRKCFPIFFC